MKHVAAVACVLLVGGAGYFAIASFGNLPASQAVATERPALAPAVMGVETRSAPPGMKEYRNEQYRFSVLVPDSVAIIETDEGQAAMTITLEDREAEVGFQVFVVPFLDEQITEERFRMDIPSGVRRDMQDITIDGATGASFFSEHPAFGETAEVWFIRNGYLFEVTTLKPLASWLTDIMATWEFLDPS